MKYGTGPIKDDDDEARLRELKADKDCCAGAAHGDEPAFLAG